MAFREDVGLICGRPDKKKSDPIGFRKKKNPEDKVWEVLLNPEDVVNILIQSLNRDIGVSPSAEEGSLSSLLYSCPFCNLPFLSDLPQQTSLGLKWCFVS